MRSVVHRLIAAAGLCLLSSLSCHAAPADLRFRHYSAGDGLSDNHVNCAVQDSTGYIWIGTANGLNRFDGYGFTVFRHDTGDDSSIAGNNVQCLYVDGKGKIWAGLISGRASCYDPERESFTNYNYISSSFLNMSTCI